MSVESVTGMELSDEQLEVADQRLREEVDKRAISSYEDFQGKGLSHLLYQAANIYSFPRKAALLSAFGPLTRELLEKLGFREDPVVGFCVMKDRFRDARGVRFYWDYKSSDARVNFLEINTNNPSVKRLLTIEVGAFMSDSRQRPYMIDISRETPTSFLGGFWHYRMSVIYSSVPRQIRLLNELTGFLSQSIQAGNSI